MSIAKSMNRVASLLLAVTFIFTNTAYSLDRTLRVPLQLQTEAGKRRTQETMEAANRDLALLNSNFKLLKEIPSATKALEDRDLKGQRVLVRVNVNVRSKDGKIEDTTRLDNTMGITRFLLAKGATPIFYGHNGRLDKKKGSDDRQSLGDVARYIQTLFPDTKVQFHDGSIPKDTGEGLKIQKSDISLGAINIVENVRFADEYELGSKRKEFAQSLVELSDGILVFDAFGDIGSTGASVEDVPLAAKEVYAGPSMLEEFERLEALLGGFDALIFGGAKLDKIPLLRGLVNVLTSGGFALIGSGPSPVLNTEQSDLLKELRDGNKERVITALDYSEEGKTFDIGSETIEKFLQKLDTLQKGQTVLLNGTMGWMEEKSGKYQKGTEIVINKLIELARREVRIIVIGGDASSTANKYGLAREKNVILFSGGGVPLQILGGEELSGLKALSERQRIISGEASTRLARDAESKKLASNEALERATEAVRISVIGGNWKMEITSEEEAETLLRKIIEEMKTIDVTGVEVVIGVPIAFLGHLSKVLRDLEAKKEISKGAVKIAAQNVAGVEKGAQTGRTSILQIKNLGAAYVIIGHSEQRRTPGMLNTVENDAINKKVQLTFKEGLGPIVCVGESLDERESGKTNSIIEDMIRKAFAGLNKEQASKVVVAYEPVWAIGTGKTATPQQAEEVLKFIRRLMLDMFDEDTASKVRIIYGGSVKPDNIAGLMNKSVIPDNDGALVGGASLKADSFIGIVKGVPAGPVNVAQERGVEARTAL